MYIMIKIQWLTSVISYEFVIISKIHICKIKIFQHFAVFVTLNKYNANLFFSILELCQPINILRSFIHKSVSS